MPQQEMLTKESADRILQGEVSSVMKEHFTYKANFRFGAIGRIKYVRLQNKTVVVPGDG